MNWEDFKTVEFEPRNADAPGFVYVVCYLSGGQPVPFYVGQTRRLNGRLDDYYWAMFSASTDFRVGEAIRYLASKGYRVVFKYTQTATPLKDESAMLTELRQRYHLLNDVPGFDWGTADEQVERRQVQEFVSACVSSSTQF